MPLISLSFLLLFSFALLHPLFLSFLLSFPFTFYLSFLSSLPLSCFFWSVMSFPRLTFPHLMSSLSNALLVLILQRSNFIGRAFKNQYRGIKLVLLLFCYYNSFRCVCVCLRSLPAHTEKAVVRLTVCMCVFARVPAIAGALLPAPRQRGHSPKWIHQALSLPLCVVSSSSCLHQHMQIPSALMSLHVYVRRDELINCGNSRSKLVKSVFMWFPNNYFSSCLRSACVYLIYW